jgi:hypothetical protein
LPFLQNLFPSAALLPLPRVANAQGLKTNNALLLGHTLGTRLRRRCHIQRLMPSASQGFRHNSNLARYSALTPYAFLPPLLALSLVLALTL